MGSVGGALWQGNMFDCAFYALIGVECTKHDNLR